MKKSRGIAVLLLTAIVTVFFCYVAAVGIGPTGTGSAKNINTGLDLAGGVSITYQAKDSNPSKEDMSDTVYKMQQRVSQYSTEAQAYQEGSNRITIEIPGVSDANAILEELGKPGSLYFIDQTDADGNQNFTTGNSESGYVLARSIEDIQKAGSVVLEGTDVADAEGGAYQDSSTSSQKYAVSLTLTKNGKTKFAEATKANVGKQIAIVYDDQVLSAPNVNEEISGGKAQITGMASTEEAQNLASYIRIGSLSLELTELRSSVVAAQLGEEAIATSVKAGAIGLVIVMLIMIIAYRIPGLVASVALVLYTTLMLITLNAFDITLTLPGIAGIILGIGMAVDANVIIYARIREEIAAGLSVHAAIKSGFGKAFSAIFDGNITTLIAACVLMWLGSGSVKGFAYTLAMGIVISMFTALVISRLVINAVYAIGVRDPKFYGIAKERKVVDFVGKRKIFFAVSIILILCGPVGMLVHSNVIGDKAMNYSLEFSGGTSTNVTFNKEMDIKEIDSEVTPVVEAVTGDKNVQPTKVQGTNQVVIKTRSLDLKEREALNKALEENFDVDTSLITSENISATVSNEMRRDAIVAVIVAMVVFVIILQDAERRIPVQYSKKMQGRKMVGGQSTSIPLKVNTAGVIPVIFASSLMSFPVVIAGFFQVNYDTIGGKILLALNSSSWFNPERPAYSVGLIVYIALIIVFAYFYTSITFNPLEVANNMKKSGGFIPGIRPGKPTSDYLDGILEYIILIGACGLIIVCLVPIIVSGLFSVSRLSFGGTSLIIIVGVVLETIKAVESQMLVRNYKGFLND